jgi:hypothetical protein
VLSYIGLSETSIHYTCTLKMATAMSAETLDNFQHSKKLLRKPEVGCTLILLFAKDLLVVNLFFAVYFQENFHYAVKFVAASEKIQEDRNIFALNVMSSA